MKTHCIMWESKHDALSNQDLQANSTKHGKSLGWGLDPTCSHPVPGAEYSLAGNLKQALIHSQSPIKIENLYSRLLKEIVARRS